MFLNGALTWANPCSTQIGNQYALCLKALDSCCQKTGRRGLALLQDSLTVGQTVSAGFLLFLKTLLVNRPAFSLLDQAVGVSGLLG